MSRFSDQMFVVAPGSPPVTTTQLLRDLKIDLNAPPHVRKAAVTQWLADHDPTSRLLECLVVDGLIDTLAADRSGRNTG